jgi:hypothetical protein
MRYSSGFLNAMALVTLVLIASTGSSAEPDPCSALAQTTRPPPLELASYLWQRLFLCFLTLRY